MHSRLSVPSCGNKGRYCMLTSKVCVVRVCGCLSVCICVCVCVCCVRKCVSVCSSITYISCMIIQIYFPREMWWQKANKLWHCIVTVLVNMTQEISHHHSTDIIHTLQKGYTQYCCNPNTGLHVYTHINSRWHHLNILHTQSLLPLWSYSIYICKYPI